MASVRVRRPTPCQAQPQSQVDGGLRSRGHRRGRCRLMARHKDVAITERPRSARRVAGSFGDRNVASGSSAARVELALHAGERRRTGSAVPSASASAGFLAAGQRRLDPAAALAHGSRRIARACRATAVGTRSPRRDVRRPAEGRPQVVAVDVQPVQPRGRLRPHHSGAARSASGRK